MTKKLMATNNLWSLETKKNIYRENKTIDTILIEYI